MDPSLLAQQKAFRARALAQPVIEKKASAYVSSQPSSVSSAVRKPVPHKLFQQRATSSTDATQQKKPPLYRLIHTIVEYLKKAEMHKSLSDIKEATGIDIFTDAKLFQAIRENPKLDYDSVKNTLLFKPMYNVRNKAALAELLKEHDTHGYGGVLVSDLQESYAAINDDIEELRKEDRAIVLERSDTHKKVIFYSDPKYAMHVDPEFQELWKAVSLPQECDIESYLDRVGLAKMMTHNEVHKPSLALKKKRKIRKNIKLQNVHVKHLNLSADYEKN